jgi:hypothetical protein
MISKKEKGVDVLKIELKISSNGIGVHQRCNQLRLRQADYRLSQPVLESSNGIALPLGPSTLYESTSGRPGGCATNYV